MAFDSTQKRTIQEVLEWYVFQVEVLGREKARVLNELASAAFPSDSRFFEMGNKEIEDFFHLHKNELDFVTMLVMMAAAEATVRLDFMERVDRRWRDAVSKAFKAIHKDLSKKDAADRVRLEEDILDTCAATDERTKGPIGDFKGALKLRHWLAHGRYWNDVQMGRRQYSPQDVFDISNNLLQAIDETKAK
jgi:hypothetical protein